MLGILGSSGLIMLFVSWFLIFVVFLGWFFILCYFFKFF